MELSVIHLLNNWNLEPFIVSSDKKLFSTFSLLTQLYKALPVFRIRIP